VFTRVPRYAVLKRLFHCRLAEEAAMSVLPDAITVRVGPRPGDLGDVLAMHGRLYAAEYGYSPEFEAHVAKGIAGFAAALGAAREDPSRPEPGWLWLAERDGVLLGTVALTREGSGVGQRRWFLVDPQARGGLGARLLDVLLAQARAAEMTRIVLWTVDGLDAAARLYTRAGFRRAEERPVHQWGHDLVEVRYELPLAPNTDGG
jgi:GNAT superfamily N-acetyltransferase